MKMISLLIILSTFLDGSYNLSKIAKENSLKKEAEAAFKEGRYEESIAKLNDLIKDSNKPDDQAMLNLGHAYYKNNDLENAAKWYEKVAQSTNKNLKSAAAQQLGNISIKSDNDKEKALAFYKEAMKANPKNREAQVNYELLKKMRKEDKKDDQKKDDKKDDQKKDDKKEGDQKDQNKDGKGNKDQKDGKGDKKDGKSGDDKDGKGDKKEGKDGDKKDGKDGEKKDGKDGDKKDGDKGKDKEGDKGKDKDEQAKGNKEDKEGKNEGKGGKDDGKENEEGNSQKEKQGGKKSKNKVAVNPEALAQMGMTEQRAKALLNAMRSNESQYIQQVKREPAKKSKKGKPDW